MIRSIRLTFFAYFFLIMSFNSAFSQDMRKDQIWIQNSQGALLTFSVELAENWEQHKIGLMNRLSLPEDSGMLFLFEGSEKMRSFWMRNTLIPLDILFLARDGTIHHIHHMAKPQDDAHISSERPSFAVLEINGGYAQDLDIQVGDQVLHPVFRNMLAQ